VTGTHKTLKALFFCLLPAITPAAGAVDLQIDITSGIGQTLPDLSGAVLYLNSADPAQTHSPVSPDTRVEMAQQDLQFVPFIRVLQKGTHVAFPNRDDVAHHVYSYSRNNAFEFKLYKGREVPSKSFDVSGQVSLGCNIHDWMEAYIYVVDTPWFTQATQQQAQLQNVPEGEYTLHFWHPGIDRRETIAVPLSLTGQKQSQAISLSYEIKPTYQATAPEDQFDESSDY